MYWNWNKTLTGLFIIGMLFFGLSIIVQNIVFLNSINSLIPVGLLVLIIFSIATISHFYQVLKWYSYVLRTNYNHNHKPIMNIIIHVCLYLIVIAIVLSIPVNLKSPEILSGGFIMDISDNINTIKTYSYYPKITGANDDEYKYIQNILNNTNPEIRNMITSVNVVSDQKITNFCEYDAIGCAFNDGRIYVVPISFWKNPHLTQNEYITSGEGYIRCSTFAWTLNHEIGHIKGFMVGDESEMYAENYAYDHTTVNLVYEPKKKC